MLTIDEIIAGALAPAQMALEPRAVVPRTAETPRADPIYLQPVELASEGLIQLHRQAARSDLTTLVLPAAVKRLSAIINNDNAPPAAHVAAIRTVFDYSLGNLDDAAQRKAPSEMTADEVMAAITKLKDEIANRPVQMARSSNAEDAEFAMCEEEVTALA